MKDLATRTFDAMQRGRRFVTHDVWHIGRPGEQIPHGFVIKNVRVAILLVRNVIQDDLLLRAAALTFATTLALVPFLAMMFFVIQTFHLDENLYRYLTQRLLTITGQQEAPVYPSEPGLIAPPYGAANRGANADSAPDARTEASTKADLVKQALQLLLQGVAQESQTADGKPLENPVRALVDYAVDYAKAGSDPHTLGLAGALFVLATVFGLMRNIESSFNRIWGVKRSRPWYRIISDYLAILLFLPFLVVGVLSVTVVVQLLEQQTPLAFALRGIQYVAIWLVFTAIYVLLPNTKVHFRYGVLGGVVAGTLWSLAAGGYVKFQFGLPRYSLLYSASAQFPVLLLWIFVSWLILLLGAELTFAYQNEKTFAMERLADGASHAYREAVAVRAMIEIARRFEEGAAGLVVEESAEAWNVPTRLANDMLDMLEKAGLVIRLAGEPVRYQPGRSTERITVGDVVSALREFGHEPSLLRQDEELHPLFEALGQRHDPPQSQTMAQLVRRSSAPSTAAES